MINKLLNLLGYIKESESNGTIICPDCKTKSYQKIWNSNTRVCRRGDCGYAEYASGSTEQSIVRKYLTEGYQPKGCTPVPKKVPNLQSGYKPTIITEGNIKRGGVNPIPTSPKPPAKIVGQK